MPVSLTRECVTKAGVMILREKLRQFRKAHGVTQSEVADELKRTRELLEIDFASIRGVSDRETGEVALTETEYTELCAAIKRVHRRKNAVSVDDLMSAN